MQAVGLGSLPAQLRLEVQYALQRRHDERAGMAPPFVVMIMVRFLAASGVSSLLDRTDYLADLHAALTGRPEHGAHVSAIGLFLTAARQHGWAGLPPDAMIFLGDQPPRSELLPVPWPAT